MSGPAPKSAKAHSQTPEVFEAAAEWGRDDNQMLEIDKFAPLIATCPEALVEELMDVAGF